MCQHLGSECSWQNSRGAQIFGLVCVYLSQPKLTCLAFPTLMGPLEHSFISLFSSPHLII